MDGNLRTPNSYPFVMIKGQNKNSLHPRHLSKMELWKGKIE